MFCQLTQQTTFRILVLFTLVVSKISTLLVDVSLLFFFHVNCELYEFLMPAFVRRNSGKVKTEIITKVKSIDNC